MGATNDPEQMRRGGEMSEINRTHDDIACEIVLAWLPHGATLLGKDLAAGDPKSYEEVGRRIGAVYKEVLKAVEDASQGKAR
jgi:hypothetical protein